MEIKEHKNLEYALIDLLPEDSEHVLVRHSLSKGEKIEEHFHPHADEYIILNNGIVRITLSGDTMEINSTNRTISVTFPKEHYHGLEALSDINYFVVRTEADETIYR